MKSHPIQKSTWWSQLRPVASGGRLGTLTAISATAVLLAAQTVSGSIAGPYSSDSSTLLLFHLDESATGSNTLNYGTLNTSYNAFSVNLTAAGTLPATVTNVIGASNSFSGFGKAANLNTAGYLIGFDYNGSGAYDGDVSSSSLSADAITMSTLNLGNGGLTPWTLEAMIRPTVTNQNQEIICADSSASSRAFQFKINTTGQLEINFINGSSSGTADIKTAIPSAGAHAFVAGTWYHVAATYDGSYVRLYWTLVDASITQANLISTTAVGISSTFGALTGPLCFGGENRAANGEYFRGLIDEVRLSSVCRAPNAMLFAGGADIVVNPTTIVPATAPLGARVTISAVASATAPVTNQWLFTANGVTTAIPAATNATYVIPGAVAGSAGSYQLVVSDSSGSVTNTAATLTVVPLAGAGVTIVDYGTSNPVPGANDQYQFGAASMSTGGSAQDGLNYFSDSTAPGQTFTTGSSSSGYVINGVFVKTSGLNGSATTTAQTYTLRLYSVSGSTATLLSTYVSANTLAFPDGDWVAYLGGITNVLQPNTTYAYTHHRNTTGWDLMSYNNSGTDGYTGGNMCVIAAAGGAITFGSSGVDDATFAVSLSTMPATPVIYQQPVGQTVVVGQAASFAVGAWAASPTYQWYTSSDTNYTNPQLIPGATSSTYVIASASLLNGTNYFVVLNSSVTSSVVSLTVRLSVNSLAWLGTNSYNWDLTSPNWSNTVTLAGGATYQTGDNVRFTDNGKSASPISLATALTPTSVAVSTSSNYVFGGSGSLAGNVQLAKSGTGTLVISNANTFRGPISVANGTLLLANATALGIATNTVTVNGGTLDFGGTAAPVTLQYNIQGTGYTNAGALNNSGGGIQNGNGVLGVNLTGDATIGAAGRWDLNGDGGGTGLHGNGYNLTKVGAGSTWFIDSGSNQLANINILNGTLGFQGTNDLGDPTKTISVFGGGLGFYAVANSGLGMNGLGLTKNLVLSNAFFSNAGNNVTLNGAITLIGTNTQSAGYQENNSMSVTFNGPISGPGGLAIYSAEQDIFNGTNTYSGPTIINSNAVLTVSANSSLGSSSLIQVGSNSYSANAILDVSATPGLKLNSGQTLAGTGAVNGSVTNNGSVLSPGGSGAGTLSIYGNLTLAGATLPTDLGSDPTQAGNYVNDYLYVSGDLTLTGVNAIQINPLAPLSTASAYTIVNYSGALTGGAANLKVTCNNPRYTVAVVDPATTANMIQIAISGVPTPIVWKGGKSSTPNVWNHSVTNFYNSSTSAYDRFYDGDLVTFDDSAVTNIVNVTETNAAGLITLANNTSAYTFVGAGNLSGILDKEGSATVTLALSNALAVSYITNNLGTLVVSPTIDSTLSSVLVDNGSGLGAFVKGGTNVLTLGADNSSYYGTTTVSNGVLRYAAVTAFGAQGSVYVTNTGTLDINNIDTSTENIYLAGPGFNGQGALSDLTTTWPSWPYQIGHYVTLLGDAAIGANNRWDIGPSGSASLTGNGFNLTKVLTGQISLVDLGAIGVGNIDIVAGNLTFQGTTDLGDPIKSLTVESNATLSFWAGSSTYVKTNVTIINGSISSGGADNTLSATVTLQPGTNNISTSYALYLMGPVVGTGGFIKQGGGTLYLDGTNTYSGSTIIGNNSTVSVGADSSLGSTATVEIDGGSTLDVSALSTFGFGSGQTLIGNGIVSGQSIVFGSGSTLSVGFTGSTYTLTVNASVSFLAGSTNIVAVNKSTTVANDEVTGLGTVALGGTLVISNLGSALAAGDVIQLYSATNYTGTFSSIVPAIPGPGLVWNTKTLASGALTVASSVNLNPTNLVTTVSGNQLTLSWPADHIGWRLQAQTNAVGAGLGTNWVDVPNTSTINRVIIPINSTNGAVFYRMAY